MTALVALVLLTFCAAAGLAHAMALPNKMAMGPEDYFVAQQAYRGWNLIGFAIFGAIVACAALAYETRSMPTPSGTAIGALMCLALSLVVFFYQTQPANMATADWTKVPENWARLRNQWEWSHAFNAALYMAAEVLVVVSLVTYLRPARTAPSPGRTRRRLA